MNISVLNCGLRKKFNRLSVSGPEEKGKYCSYSIASGDGAEYRYDTSYFTYVDGGFVMCTKKIICVINNMWRHYSNHKKG